jgi:hypothetical protein
MGADISGWVEIRRPKWECWEAAIRIHDIVERNYGTFASLFGVRNWGEGPTSDSDYERTLEHGRFRAIAPGRGEPPGASEHYRNERHFRSLVGETWIL